MDHTNRVIVLVDMDCFYCQVEEKLDPKLVGKPVAVVQYNQWKGGGIIAVNYPARDKGVTRHMRGADAKGKCPDLRLVSVPTQRGKADLTKYREAGKRVAEVLQTFTSLLERASVDEAYLDITDTVNERIKQLYFPEIDHLPNTHVAGCDKVDFIENVKNNFMTEGDLKLCIGGVITEEIRAAIFEKTGYKCSAGIAHNKILAKLACGFHKPNQQTILPQCGIEEVYKNLPIRKIKSLGGKFGEFLGEDLGVCSMADLKKITEKELIQRYDEKTGSWLYNIARGIDLDPVTVRLVSKSIGCCKKFPGRTALTTFDDVSHWINELSEELAERLLADVEENNRKAKQMVVSFSQEINRKDVPSSRTHPLNSYESEKIASDMLNVINKHCMHQDGSYRIKYMGISAGKFEENKRTYDLTSFFNKNNESCNEKSQMVSSTSKGSSNVLLNFLTKQSEEFEQTASTRDENTLSKDVDDIDLFEETSEDDKRSQQDIGTTLNIIEDDGAIFLNETVQIEVDMNNVIFNKNCTTPDEDFKNLHSSDLSDDSITEEIIASSTPSKELVKKQSYFTNFFNNIVTPSTSKERAFDTSKYLDESLEALPEEIHENKFLINETSMDTESQLVETNIERESPILNNKSEKQIFEDNEKQSCPECNKLILISDMPSHMDYHFALKMVREESHLYANENKSDNIQKPSKVAPTERKKNKRKPEVHCNKLSLFLATAKQEVEGPSETCPECNKKVAVNNFLDHLDYHVAKKLHIELNSTATPLNAKEKINGNKKRKNGITSYFK